MRVTVVVLLLTATFAFVHPDQHCTPDQWHGHSYALTGYSSHGDDGRIQESAEIFYDYTNKRRAVHLVKYTKAGQDNMNIVTLYDEDGNEGRIFVSDVLKADCWTTKLRTPFKRNCIPDHAHFFGNYYMGLSGEYLVSGYEIAGPTSVTELGVHQYENYTIPVTENVYGRMGQYDVVEAVDIFNITVGLPEETDVFEVPTACDWKEHTFGYEHLTRLHYILTV